MPERCKGVEPPGARRTGLTFRFRASLFGGRCSGAGGIWSRRLECLLESAGAASASPDAGYSQAGNPTSSARWAAGYYTPRATLSLEVDQWR